MVVTKAKRTGKNKRMYGDYVLYNKDFATLYFCSYTERDFFFSFSLDFSLFITYPEHSLCQSNTDIHVPDNVILQFTARKPNWKLEPETYTPHQIFFSAGAQWQPNLRWFVSPDMPPQIVIPQPFRKQDKGLGNSWGLGKDAGTVFLCLKGTRERVGRTYHWVKVRVFSILGCLVCICSGYSKFNISLVLDLILL